MRGPLGAPRFPASSPGSMRVEGAMSAPGINLGALLCGLAIVGSLASLGACSDSASIDPSSFAVVRGHISAMGGRAVGGARIDLLATDPKSGLTVDAVASSDPTGAYEGLLGEFLTPSFTGHLRVTVTPPEGSGLQPAARDSVPIRLRADPDTLVVNVELLSEAGA